MAQLDIAEKRMPQDGSFVVYIGGNAVDVRAAVLPTKHGEQVVLRVLQRETKLELPDLGMSPEMENVFMQAIEQPHGAVMTCGPTGSGKTTTLYAALDRLNDGLALDRDDRGPRRVPAARRDADGGAHARSASPSAAACAPSCAPTPT